MLSPRRVLWPARTSMMIYYATIALHEYAHGNHEYAKDTLRKVNSDVSHVEMTEINKTLF